MSKTTKTNIMQVLLSDKCKSFAPALEDDADIEILKKCCKEFMKENPYNGEEFSGPLEGLVRYLLICLTKGHRYRHEVLHRCFREVKNILYIREASGSLTDSNSVFLDLTLFDLYKNITGSDDFRSFLNSYQPPLFVFEALNGDMFWSWFCYFLPKSFVITTPFYKDEGKLELKLKFKKNAGYLEPNKMQRPFVIVFEKGGYTEELKNFLKSTEFDHCGDIKVTRTDFNTYLDFSWQDHLDERITPGIFW